MPTVGSTAGPDYATQINAAILEIRTTVDSKVTPAGFQMSADLSFLDSATYRAATNLERVNYQNKSVAINASTYPRALYVVNGELYYNDASGRQIQVTNAGALNISATGGITGAGYGSSGVEVAWSSADAAYKFKTAAGADAYADLWCDDVLLNDGSGNYWRIQSPALAGDLTLELPNAYPASTSLMQMSSAGVVSLTRDPSVTTVTTSGLITAGAGLTASVNQDVTISGTGKYKHGAYVLQIHAAAGLCDTAANYSFSDDAWVGNNVIHFPVMLPIGSRITSIDILANYTGGTGTLQLYYRGTAGNVSASGPHTTATTGIAVQTVDVTDSTIGADRAYYVEIDTSNAADIFYGLAITYDRP